MMLKKVAIMLAVFGMICMVYGGWQLWSTKQSQKAALAEANKDIQENKAVNKGGSASTSFHFEKGQAIGILQIPGIDKELPIVEGTDEEALKQGVGHYTGSVYPGQKNQILLSGHRDTVFTGLDKLKHGDKLTVKMQHGSFTYAIVDTKIVDENDQTIIRSTAPNEVLTLSTCYPFHYIGNAPKRYIIYAVPVKASGTGTILNSFSSQRLKGNIMTRL
ncbi:class D sortase [Virgibacillus sp. 179-BFC.A HS]|uniref:Class D sortase n=1 Tax=Tigheibacillus jepli TaxID=3035914 RepID=A0ABU5CES1_9BACI|nr:class D sortase [Virgibacillus sp. 179-BFC.A HS]MDY0404820.1 class D sortase [Virgibacillus sp. 179-BFC.A HS]